MGRTIAPPDPHWFNAMSDLDHLQQIAHLRREYTKGGCAAAI
ncbi:Pyridoxamine 5'-phosphate oxidase [Cronobacter dublinensis 1210]|uniref:Pyridoxamine 5'-phosphate oxidase n=1 Tax=Cronobacter dublinensis 1210 TaxID=1208656 RepID=A0ABM9Q636_9ENTR|nr:Pyridoxamine 5'-phosphate oxidase [Cronobacter dublinensis 1210]